jgi:predicted aspartyl protease
VIGRLLLWLCLLTGPAAACAVDRVTAVPIEDAGPLMLIAVQVNEQPGRFILDTGAALTVVTPAAVTRFGLALDEWTATTMRGIGGVERRRNAVPRTLTLGGIPLHRRSVASDQTLRVASLPAEVAGQPVDGLLGRDFLFGFDLDLDPARHALTLYRVADCAGAFVPWPVAPVSLPVTLAGGSAVLVPVAIDGVPLRALLDTGAAASFLAAPGMTRLARSLARLGDDPAQTTRGVGPGTVTARRHQFRSLTVGTEVTADPTLLVAPLQLTPVSDLLLGMDWIRRHRLWLSPATARVFVVASGG